MSFMERERIYEEMEGNTNNRSKSRGFFSKLLTIIIFLSIGFASGSIYSTFNNNSNNDIESSANILLPENNNSTITEIIPTPTVNNTAILPNSLSGVVNKTADCVVEITQYSTSTNIFSQNYTSQGNGSGVIISKDGYILTNNHVINGAEKISVRLRNGDEYEATLIGKDAKTDMAVIKIEGKNLVAATIGDSSKTLVGDFVLAIGNPLGKLGGTVTYGYVSALEREITLDSSTKNLMQFDAAVNPGNSGGGLFNINGELVGIVSAKSTGYDVEGLGFAIPINDVSTVINDILNYGYATNRPFLGVSMTDSSTPSSNNQYGSVFDLFFQQMQYGARVDSVVENSPAEKAGIESGDIIVSINGKVISTSADASAEISECSVGDEVEIGIIREGRTKTVKATLEEYKGQ